MSGMPWVKLTATFAGCKSLLSFLVLTLRIPFSLPPFLRFVSTSQGSVFYVPTALVGGSVSMPSCVLASHPILDCRDGSEVRYPVSCDSFRTHSWSWPWGFSSFNRIRLRSVAFFVPLNWLSRPSSLLLPFTSRWCASSPYVRLAWRYGSSFCWKTIHRCEL